MKSVRLTNVHKIIILKDKFPHQIYWYIKLKPVPLLVLQALSSPVQLCYLLPALCAVYSIKQSITVVSFLYFWGGGGFVVFFLKRSLFQNLGIFTTAAARCPPNGGQTCLPLLHHRADYIFSGPLRSKSALRVILKIDVCFNRC